MARKGTVSRKGKGKGVSKATGRAIIRRQQPWQDNPWLVLGVELCRIRTEVEKCKGATGYLDGEFDRVLHSLKEAQAGCLACGASFELLLSGAYAPMDQAKARARKAVRRTVAHA
jgi:hypothetical protein